LLQAYCIGTCTAIGVAGSLRGIFGYVLRGRSGAMVDFLKNYCVAYAAVASSSSVNVYSMRMGEMHTGVSVFDDTGAELGQSKVAAKQGIERTIYSRFAYVLPIFVVPALWNMAL